MSEHKSKMCKQICYRRKIPEVVDFHPLSLWIPLSPPLMEIIVPLQAPISRFRQLPVSKLLRRQSVKWS